MTTKTTFRVTAPNGQSFYRTSAHDYKAAVLLFDYGTWGVYGFRSTRVGAEKLAAQIRGWKLDREHQVEVVDIDHT